MQRAASAFGPENLDLSDLFGDDRVHRDPGGHFGFTFHRWCNPSRSWPASRWSRV